MLKACAINNVLLVDVGSEFEGNGMFMCENHIMVALWIK